MSEAPNEVQVPLEEVFAVLRQADIITIPGSDFGYLIPGWDVDTHSLTLATEEVDEGMEWLKGQYTLCVIRGESESRLGYSNDEGRITIPWTTLEHWRSPETKLVFREGFEGQPLSP